MPSSAATDLFVHVPIRQLSPEALEKLSRDKKLSLSREDMVAVQAYFVEKDREPTDVELEVIAQTWSEHCKHRIFGSQIEHSLNGKPEVVDGLFKSYIRATAERIMERKPGFVLSAFVDNAGFIKLDETHAVCLKVETHNHPSAIEPYAGANTGLGGVIRDILGAGLGAKPIANLDVFCFGAPDTRADQIKAMIQQGTKIPYQQATSSGATSVAFVDATLKLEVTPQITPEGNVIMAVEVNKDSVGASTQGIPSINTKSVKTQVLVENGGTVVIGGIFEQTERSDEAKVPLLGDVPVLGNLFKTKTKSMKKTELLIFLTPRVVSERTAAR